MRLGQATADPRRVHDKKQTSSTQGTPMDDQYWPILVLRRMPVHLGGDLTKIADLVIRPGQITLEWVRWGPLPAWGGESYRQHGGHVEILTFRFPPWQNSVLHLGAAGKSVTVTMTRRQRSTCATALEQAGFDVRVRRAGFFVTYRR